MTEVAPGVLFSDFDIFPTPALAFAIVFICRTSSLVHSRRTIFLALVIFAPVFVKRPCITRHDNGNGMIKRHMCISNWNQVQMLPVALCARGSNEGSKGPQTAWVESPLKRRIGDFSSFAFDNCGDTVKNFSCGTENISACPFVKRPCIEIFGCLFVTHDRYCVGGSVVPQRSFIKT